jgi:hypothetical protein
VRKPISKAAAAVGLAVGLTVLGGSVIGGIALANSSFSTPAVDPSTSHPGHDDADDQGEDIQNPHEDADDNEINAQPEPESTKADDDEDATENHSAPPAPHWTPMPHPTWSPHPTPSPTHHDE